MSENQVEIIEKSISRRLNDVWANLSLNQRRFVIAMQNHKTKAEAAQSIGLQKETVYGWDGVVNEAIELISQNTKETAIAILAQDLVKAAWIKAKGLDSEHEKTRQDVATEILDRMLGKPTQRQEIGGADGASVITTIEIIKPDDND